MAFDFLQRFSLPPLRGVFFGLFLAIDRILVSFDLLFREADGFEVILDRIVQRLHIVLNLERFTDLLAQNDRLPVVNQALYVRVFVLGWRVSAALWLVRVVQLSLVEIVLCLLDLLFNRVDCLVLGHQLVGLLYLILLLLEVRIRIVDLVSQAHELFLLLGQALIQLEVRRVVLDLRLNETVHFMLPFLVQLSIALLLVGYLVDVDGILGPLRALFIHIILMLEQVVKRKLFELFNL